MICPGESCSGCEDPSCMAAGGEVGEDGAMLDQCCGELMDAIGKKDKAAMLEALRAIVLSVR